MTMQQWNDSALVAAFLFAVALVTPARGFAQQAPAPDAQPDAAATSESAPAAKRRVAVVALGEGARSGSVMQTLLSLLDADGYEVIGEERLRRLMASRLVPRPPARVSAQFVGLTTRIGDGIEKFFYKGNDDALKILTPAFNLGMAYPEILARRPDFARQVFEAGLVMIRAYRNLHRMDDARRLARALVQTFPGFNARANSVPPPVAQLLKSQREEMAKARARLQIQMIAGDGCQAQVNGTVVDEHAFAVAAGEPYFVTMECGSGEAPLWRVEAHKGRTQVVPIAPQNPLDYQMPNAGFRHRKLAEHYLEMLSFWAKVPRVLGVADADADKAPDSVVLVHVRADGAAEWSDRADKSTVSHMLSRVMMDYRGGESTDGTDSSAASLPAHIDWVSWSMVSGGVALTALSGWGLYAAMGRADELRCSPDSTAQTAPGECEGVPAVHFANADEFGSAKTQLNTVYALSATGLAVGLGIAGWGGYRLAAHEEPATTAWVVGLSPHGARVAATLRF